MASTYTWSLQSGALPPGLTLSGSTSRTENLVGTPTTPGVYNFTLRCTNDISAAFDDQAYTVEVFAAEIQLTPDIGLPVNQQFDPALNSKLIQASVLLATDLGAAAVEANVQAKTDLKLRADFGYGLKTYRLALSQLRNLVSLGRRYFWRSPTVSLTQVNSVVIV